MGGASSDPTADSRRPDDPSREAVIAQLDRILSSAEFAQSERLRGFLRFIVEETLAGRSDSLKEYTLALAVFGRDETFDPQTSSIVRVEASRLRGKLEMYNAIEGKEDPVHISLPPGSYVPKIQASAIRSAPAAGQSADHLAESLRTNSGPLGGHRSPALDYRHLIQSMGEISAAYPNSQERLRPYCGYYFVHSRSPSFPGRILKYVMLVYQRDGFTFTRSVERYAEIGEERSVPWFKKVVGQMIFMDERVFQLEMNVVSHSLFGLTIFYPARREKVDLLPGLCMGVSGNPGRQAFATRVVCSYLGPSVDYRKALLACGLYDEDSDAIEEKIKRRIPRTLEMQDEVFLPIIY